MRWKTILVALAIVYSLSMTGQARRTEVDCVDYYFEHDQFIKAKDNAEKLAASHLKNDRYYDYSKNVVKISDIYYRLGDEEKALKVLFNSLKKVNVSSEKKGEVLLYRRISDIYSKLHDTVKSKKFAYMALSSAKKARNDSLLSSVNQSLFYAYADGDKDSALHYLKLTKEHSLRGQSSKAKYVAYNNYYYFYISKRDFVQAKKYLDSSEIYARKDGTKAVLRMFLTNRAGYYYFLGDFKKAKKDYDDMFIQNANDTTTIDMAAFYYTYAGILYNLGKYKQAYITVDKAYSIAEDNYDLRVSKKIADVAASYQIGQMEEKSKEDRKRFAQEKSRREKVLYILVAVILITFILFYFFYQNSRLKQKNKLQEVQGKIQQNILSATLDAREAERKNIATVLHDNISALLSSAGLQLTAFAAGNAESSAELAKTRSILKEAHDKVRDLSHELVPTLLAKFGLAYALQDLCEKNSSQVITFEYEDDGNIGRYDEDFEMKVFFITSELLNNVLKHSRASRARLQLSAAENLEITVEDDGKGFEKSKAAESFGLTQIRARVTGMGGSFSIASRTNSGTVARLSVPIPQKGS